MKLTEAEITTIIYEKENGETTSRTILPVSIPKDLIRAIDLSETDLSERAELQKMYEEYQWYVQNFMKTMFNFETWAEQAHGKEIKPKWRSFKVSGLR